MENLLEKFIMDSIKPSIEELNAIKSNFDVWIDWLLYGKTAEKGTQVQDVGLSTYEILKIKQFLKDKL